MPPSSTVLDMPIVKFINEKKEIEVPEGANLRKEAMKAGVNLYNGMNGWGASINKYVNCMGLGVCGTCRVLVKKGMENTNEMGLLEKAKFRGLPLPDPASMAYIGHEDEMRLACCCEVKGDIEVETCPEFNLFGENFYS
ncbi:MAG: 2Fe-2S iron-sulfur cluster-binding protein [Pirellulaceae bacterium]